ncbi:57_t:CDS:2, partial [Acaulospora colombiana]
MGKSQSKSAHESSSHLEPKPVKKKKQPHQNPSTDNLLDGQLESSNSIQNLSTSSNRSNKSQSMASSIYSTFGSYIDERMFKCIGGRKFMISEDARYMLPFDDDGTITFIKICLSKGYLLFPSNHSSLLPQEHARLQLQHFTLRHIWESNFSAPIHELLQVPGTKVLDVGCATGTWTLEMATEYPLAKFTGIDIIPIYPSEIKPKNVEFEIANILNRLPYEDGTFDFVFMRSMSLTFTTQEWEEVVISELIRVLKPGGWIEIMESDPLWFGAGPATEFLNRV